jgi:predicted O-methyltransferase YrrM
MFFKKKNTQKLLPPPFKAEGMLHSIAASIHDDPYQPTKELIELSLQASTKALEIDLSFLNSRVKEKPFYHEIWPGEHYKLLAALTQILQPKRIIEIGTATGISALSMQSFLPEEGKISSFDLHPWNHLPNTILKEADFANGNLEQFDADLTDPGICSQFHPIFQEADLIFIDVTHDGEVEKKLMQNLEKISFSKKVYLLFDDIRFWTMLAFWRELPYPKIDLTSFGHWSGTGLVEFR